METPERLSFKDLVSLYSFEGPEEKVEPDTPTERIEMQDENAFRKNMAKAAEHSLEPFRAASKTDAQEMPIHHRDPHRPAIMDLRKLELARTIVDTAAPLELTASKLWKTTQDGHEAERIDFDLHRGQDVVGSMCAYGEGDNFNLDHRVVDPRFRRERYGNGEKSMADLLLEAEENFVKASAKKDQRPKIQTVETGQLDVMCWLWNNGYRPLPKDEATFERILGGDPAICRGLRNYLYWKDQTSVAERDGDFANWPKAVGITFVKEFQPQPSSEVVDLREHVGDQARVASFFSDKIPEVKAEPSRTGETGD